MAYDELPLTLVPLPVHVARGSWLVRGLPFEGVDALAELVVSLAKIVVE